MEKSNLSAIENGRQNPSSLTLKNKLLFLKDKCYDIFIQILY